MVLTIIPVKGGRRKTAQAEPATAQPEPPAVAAPEPPASLCVLCLDSNNISGDCDVLRLDGSGVSVKSKLLEWERDRRPAHVGGAVGSAIFDVPGSAGPGDGGAHPMCRTCLSLVSEMDSKEVDLNLLFTKFWMVVAHRREVKCGGLEPIVELSYPTDEDPLTVDAASSSGPGRVPPLVLRRGAADSLEAVVVDLNSVKREVESPEGDLPPPEDSVSFDVDEPSDNDSENSFQSQSLMEVEDNDDGDDDWAPSAKSPKTKKLTKTKDSKRSKKSGDSAKPEKPKDHICNACNKGFPTASILNQHIKKRCLVLRAQRERQASEQGSSSETDAIAGSSKNQRNRVYLTGSFMCDLCAKSCRDSYQLNRHRISCAKRSQKPVKKKPLSSAPINPYKGLTCDVCGEVGFQTNYHLNSHKLRLHGVGQLVTENGEVLRRFSCKLCGKSFDRKEERTEHEYEVHPEALRFPCPECDKKFISSEKLSAHKRSHEKIVCTVCGVETKGKELLKAHMRTHTREKKFSCKDCGESYVHLTTLWRHEWKVHGRKKDRHEFPCPICGQVLDSKRGVSMHKYSRHGVLDEGLKIYKCDRCEKSFPKRTAYLTHMRMHDDIRAHACPHPGCSYAAIAFVSVKTHMKNVHKRNVKRVFPEGCKDETVYTIVDIDEGTEVFDEDVGSRD